MTTIDPDSLPLEEQVERWKRLAETMLEDAQRYKAERDELLEKLPLIRLAEQFMTTFHALQQQVQKSPPEGYRILVPGIPRGITLSSSTHTVSRNNKDEGNEENL